MGNLIADIHQGYSPFIFIPGFFLQVTYGLLPAFAWNFLRRKDENKYQLNSVLKVVQLLLVIAVSSAYNATTSFALIFFNTDSISPALWTNYFFNQLNTTTATAIPFMIFCSLKRQFSLKRRFRGTGYYLFSFSLNEKFLFFFVIASILVSIGVGAIIHELFTYRIHVDQLYLWNIVYYGASISMNLAVWSSLAFLLYIELTVTKPIEKMSSIAKVFGKEDDIDKKISIIIDRCQKYVYYTSEVGDLARSFWNMSEELESYVKNLTDVHKEQEKNHTELSVATKIQESTLPKLEKFDRLDLHAIMNPAKEVGGDFYDFFMVDSSHIALAIADVSGKGVPAALFMMISKIILQNNLLRGYSPAEALERTNDKLCANNPLGMFVSCLCGVLDLNTGVFKFSNAGHEAPALMKKNCFFDLEKIESGFVLGGLPGIKYENFEIRMQPGEIFFFYTDGVPEAMNENKEEFGNSRMINALNANKFGSMENLCTNVHKAVQKHAGKAPQFDDITMLAFCLKES
ncbi:MAG: PP2C family protein-serine/threonine phosphatase [Fibrobacter sp.]|nr:PP2C family protein-serine/threonine phosphatase [Fibrobacter sp.]